MKLAAELARIDRRIALLEERRSLTEQHWAREEPDTPYEQRLLRRLHRLDICLEHRHRERERVICRLHGEPILKLVRPHEGAALQEKTA